MKQAAKITFTQSKRRTQIMIYPLEKKKNGGKAAFWHKVKVVCCLHRPPFYTLLEIQALWRDHVSFGGFSKLSLIYNIYALLYNNQGPTRYQRQVNIFVIQSSVCFFLQPRFLCRQTGFIDVQLRFVYAKW